LNIQEVTNTEALKRDTLAPPNRRALILPLPFHQHLSPQKIKDIKSWVERGGGLLILGHYAADLHHGSNPSQLTSRWGISFAQDVLLPSNPIPCDRDREHVSSLSDRFAIVVPIPPELSAHPLFKGVERIILVSSTWIDTQKSTVKLDLAIPTAPDLKICKAEKITCTTDNTDCAVRWELAESRPVPVLVAFKYGAGRVVIFGTWKAVNPDYGDNGSLFRNTLSWLRREKE